jgi:hypothetical protein
MKRLLMTLAVLAATQAQAQTIKPGLWESTSKVRTGNAQTDQAVSAALSQLAVLPPAQRAQVEAAMKQNGVSLPQAGSDGSLRMTACVTPEMAARNELPLSQGKCTSQQTRVAGGVDVAFSCTEPASSGTAQVRLQGDSAYTATIQVTNDTGAGPQRATVESSGRWVAASCPARQ